MRDAADIRCDALLGSDNGGIGRLVDVVNGIRRELSRGRAKVKQMVVLVLVLR